MSKKKKKKVIDKSVKNGTIQKIIPIQDALRSYHKSVRILDLIRRDGTSCKRCSAIALELVVMKDNSGSIHNRVVGINGYGSEVIFNIDHVLPLSLGGLDRWENIQLMCTTCNTKKANKFNHKGLLVMVKLQKWIYGISREMSKWIHKKAVELENKGGYHVKNRSNSKSR